MVKHIMGTHNKKNKSLEVISGAGINVVVVTQDMSTWNHALLKYMAHVSWFCVQIHHKGGIDRDFRGAAREGWTSVVAYIAVYSWYVSSCMSLCACVCYVCICAHMSAMDVSVHIFLLCMSLCACACYVCICAHVSAMYVSVRKCLLCMCLWVYVCYFLYVAANAKYTFTYAFMCLIFCFFTTYTFMCVQMCACWNVLCMLPFMYVCVCVRTLSHT